MNAAHSSENATALNSMAAGAKRMFQGNRDAIAASSVAKPNTHDQPKPAAAAYEPVVERVGVAPLDLAQLRELALTIALPAFVEAGEEHRRIRYDRMRF